MAVSVAVLVGKCRALLRIPGDQYGGRFLEAMRRSCRYADVAGVPRVQMALFARAADLLLFHNQALAPCYVTGEKAAPQVRMAALSSKDGCATLVFHGWLRRDS
jgi:hypothetical protein